MNLASLRAELEQDMKWRFDEIRYLQNIGSFVSSPEDRKRYQRSLVVMLYAHFEGFCKFSFTLYVNAVNSANITCGEANYAIAASSLHDLFTALRDPSGKCPEFRNTLPDDTKLHRLAREREFVEKTDLFLRRPIKIPDDAIDLESNVTPKVLSKNLYQIGLPHDLFKGQTGDINKLLNYRNNIAHGEAITIGNDDYFKLRDMVFRLMEEVTVATIQALSNQDYLRPQPAYHHL